MTEKPSQHIAKFLKVVFFLTFISVFSFPWLSSAQNSDSETTESTETNATSTTAESSTAEVTDGEVNKDRWEQGRKLFRANCGSCHNPTTPMTGPPLKGSVSRWTAQDDYQGLSGKEWLYRWVKNWNDPVNAGMPYAVVMKDYDPSVMNLFVALTNEEIDDIFYYTNNSEWKPATAGAPLTSDTEAKDESSVFRTLLILLIVVLAIIALVLGRVSGVLNRMVKEKEGEKISPRVVFYKSKALITAMVLIAVIFVAFELVDGAISLGRQQGYQPTQPINFSHTLHSGTHNIDCQFCHHTASKGKHANIPSVNVCMNCHMAIQKGPDGNTEEIKKIYAAADFNPLTQKYGGNPKAIEWVRVHNLPDHVYFNHQQHVVAGNIACQTCHGPVEEMEELYQYAPLSMGWCINCHRETQVQFANNDYYEIYQKLHDKGEFDKITVETIGGTDCQRCHY